MIYISKTKKYIWDTGALSLFFADHKEAKQLMEQIVKDQVLGYIPRIIYAEFFYKTWQKLGERIAQFRVVNLRKSKIIELELNQNDVFSVGTFKVNYPYFSLADCILLALAKRDMATIITTEEPITKLQKIKSIKLDY